MTTEPKPNVDYHARKLAQEAQTDTDMGSMVPPQPKSYSWLLVLAAVAAALLLLLLLVD